MVAYLLALALIDFAQEKQILHCMAVTSSCTDRAGRGASKKACETDGSVVVDYLLDFRSLTWSRIIINQSLKLEMRFVVLRALSRSYPEYFKLFRFT